MTGAKLFKSAMRPLNTFVPALRLGLSEFFTLSEKWGYMLENFPDDEPVYTIEYEDGSSLNIYERHLLPWHDDEDEQDDAPS